MEMKSQLREVGNSDNDPTKPWYFDVHVRWQKYKIWACPIACKRSGSCPSVKVHV